MLLCTKWIITREQIKIYQGVLSKRINYIESVSYTHLDVYKRQAIILGGQPACGKSTLINVAKKDHPNCCTLLIESLTKNRYTSINESKGA